MEREQKAVIFNILVVIAAVVIIVTGPLFVFRNLTFWMVQIFGVLLIVWALIARRVNKNDHTHKLPEGYFFITKGPYEIIRHPMYAGLLLIMSGLVQYNLNFLRLGAFLLLVFVILLKIIREEHTMDQLVKEYHDYKLKTQRIIPYLF
jgi:protein-S-isoprenylcysteine O-methyltransferase Ste14